MENGLSEILIGFNKSYISILSPDYQQLFVHRS